MTGPSTGEAGPVCPGGQAGGDSGAVETLLQASRVLVGIASRGLEQLGEEVTNSQFRLLSVLGEYGPIASVEAAGWLGSAGSSVTALRKIVSRGQLYHSTSVSGEPGRAADLMNPP